MKNLLIILSTLFIHNLTAQNFVDDKTKELIVVSENSKSGNYKDIFASIFQLAARNIVGEDKSLAFNSTLFALKLKANPDVNRDDFFLKETFSRNLQVNFKANFDEEYSYTGFTGGLTYALYNGRDSKLVKMNQEFIDTFNNLENDLESRYSAIGSEITDAAYSEEEKVLRRQALSDAKEAILNNEAVTDSFTNEYKAAMLASQYNNSQQLADKNGSPIISLQGVSEYLNNAADTFYEELKSAPLLTIAVDGTSNKDGKFDRASAALVYLQGVKKSDFEIDIRTSFNYSDTLAVNQPQTSFESQAGVNFILGRGAGALQVLKQSTRQSFFEVKSYVEYRAILKNRLPYEKKDNFSANADIRLRVAEGLWIPFTIKYDVESANVFGFLNVSYNFE